MAYNQAMSPVRYELAGGVATVTLDRPQKLNALDAAGYRALHEAVTRFSQDREAKCLVLTGAGRAFCAGQDLDEVPDLQRRTARQVRKGLDIIQDTTRLLLACSRPTLAAINGPAVGAGAEIPLACDLRLGKEGCFFLFPELQHGLFQTNASTCLLPRLVGHGRASEMLLLGERVGDQAALACGLLNRVLPADEFAAVVRETAERLAGLPQPAAGLLKRALREHPGAGVEAALSGETEASMALMCFDD
jgi:2-(1,2-epoxy-1,2-dihydrophenyl)acetyl-CoA isomerase